MRSDDDWNELGTLEPYFAVLTDPRFLRANLREEDRAAFFDSGERDVEMLLDLVRSAGGPIDPPLALDFGCGIGRLAFPLAKRSGHVIGVDTARSMLEKAESLRRELGIENVRFITTDELYTLEPHSIAFVQSLIVFQHIPVAEGERLLRQLLTLLRPGGWFAIEISFERPGGPVRRLLRRARAGSPLIHRAIQLVRRERSLPYMQMNEYDEDRIDRLIRASGAEVLRRQPTDQGGIRGAILVGRTGVCAT